jgi:endoglucanase
MLVRRKRFATRVLAGVAALALSAAVAVPGARAAQPGNPMAGGPWYVDDQTAAAQVAQADAAAGETASASLLARIAQTPQSKWFIAADAAGNPYVTNFFARARAAVAQDPATITVITLHGLPDQVCSGQNAPGAGSSQQYENWINGYAQLIGSMRVDVFLEPDALAASSCLSPSLRAQRLELMSYAARTLSALGHTGVYEDAGAGDWRPLKTMAALLKGAGVRYARGFSLNTTHYDWTGNEVLYGRRLSRLLGGKHFVVNTAFNGRGPQLDAHGGHLWCNPIGRSLGPLPTLRTPSPLVDAFFWLGNPGLSDGTCNGGPEVGLFWPKWALALVRDTAGARDFPTYRGGL